MEKSITVLPEEADLRLDRVLGRLVPDMGLRGRRRLCELGLALVNGRPAKASYDVKVGDKLQIQFGARTVCVEVLQVADNVRKDDAVTTYKEV